MAHLQARLPKRRQVSRSKLVAALDTAFSQWVRLSGADSFGRQQCWTCGVVKHWKEMDAGHFQTRAKYATRWDPLNVKPQCKHCNLTNAGHQYQFGLNLDRKYGPGTAWAVQVRSNQTARFSTHDLETMIAEFRAKVRELESNGEAFSLGKNQSSSSE